MPSPGVGYSPYHHVRDQVLGRRERQQVNLVNGNLVLECPVPQSILTYAKAYGSEPTEFKT
jgi:chitin synthase